MLLSTTLSCRWLMLPSSGGSVPVSTFLETSTNDRVDTCPSTAGTLPFRPRKFSHSCDTPPTMVVGVQVTTDS